MRGRIAPQIGEGSAPSEGHRLRTAATRRSGGRGPAAAYGFLIRPLSLSAAPSMIKTGTEILS